MFGNPNRQIFQHLSENVRVCARFFLSLPFPFDFLCSCVNECYGWCNMHYKHRHTQPHSHTEYTIEYKSRFSIRTVYTHNLHFSFKQQQQREHKKIGLETSVEADK